MAESKSVAIVPLNGSNYPTWKVQCRMALVKDGLWSTVNGTETIPEEREADKCAKFVARRDRALALIVLSVEPSLLSVIQKIRLLSGRNCPTSFRRHGRTS